MVGQPCEQGGLTGCPQLKDRSPPSSGPKLLPRTPRPTLPLEGAVDAQSYSGTHRRARRACLLGCRPCRGQDGPHRHLGRPRGAGRRVDRAQRPCREGGPAQGGASARIHHRLPRPPRRRRRRVPDGSRCARYGGGSGACRFRPRGESRRESNESSGPAAQRPGWLGRAGHRRAQDLRDDRHAEGGGAQRVTPPARGRPRGPPPRVLSRRHRLQLAAALPHQRPGRRRARRARVRSDAGRR